MKKINCYFSVYYIRVTVWERRNETRPKVRVISTMIIIMHEIIIVTIGHLRDQGALKRFYSAQLQILSESN
jgi:hypothetical protein